MADTWGWKEVKLFFRFTFYSMTCIATFSGLWVFFDLPQVASKDFVISKFQPVQSQLNATRLQLNKMTRQTLEAEHYRLTTENKSNISFDIQKRINDVNEQMLDNQRERDALLNSH